MGAYNIYKINSETQNKTRLYEFINTLKEAELLAQLAMKDKTSVHDLIFISPGWNRRIENYIKALELAEKYKVNN